MKLLGIVMPVYNEAGWVTEVVRRVMAQEVPLEKWLVICRDALRARR